MEVMKESNEAVRNILSPPKNILERLRQNLDVFISRFLPEKKVHCHKNL